MVNFRLSCIAQTRSWMRVIQQPDFHTLFGANRQLLSTDGLHLSYEGTETLTSNIESSVRSLHQEIIICKPQTSVLTTQTLHTPVYVSSTAASWKKVTSTRSATAKLDDLSPSNRLPNPTSPIRSLPSAPISGRRKLRKAVHASKRHMRLGCRKSEILLNVPSNSLTSSTPLQTKHSKTQCRNSSKFFLLESAEMFYLSTDNVKLVGGGSECPMFTKTDRVLSHQEAGDILIQNIQDSITKETPFRPASGSVFVYDDSGDPSKREDWRADGYTWRNYGKRVYETDGKKLERVFFVICNQGAVNQNFRRHVFRFKDSDYNGRTLIAYYGDSDAYKGLAHGNRKRNDRQHKRTKPSVLNNIKAKGTENNPQSVHDKLHSEISPETTHKGVSVPRNERQIINIQSKLRKDNKLSHDALYGLHVLVDQLDNFILSIKTTPDLEVVIGNSEMFDEVNRLLQLKNVQTEFYYDTTFNLGDFYVSTLVCQHPMFKERPILPVAFMLHERKFQSCHEQFIETIKKKIPKLAERNICVVSDREKGIINAFQEKLPNAQILICWNHIFTDIKFWVRKHGGGNDDKKVYEMNVRSLLQCETQELFENLYSDMKQKWSEAFVTYFEENMYQTIKDHSGRWILEPKEMYNPYSGVTNNASESLNAKLKRLIYYKERNIDEIVLYLYYMQGNDLTELIKAFCGESELTLSNQFKFASKDPDSVELPKNICHPDKLIELIKGELSYIISKKDSPEKLPHEINDENKVADKMKSKDNTSKSQRSLAVKTIAENNIVLVPQMSAFMVNGSKDKYSVTLFPKEKCSCPATSRCYHIMAAMMAIGMPIPDEKKVYNLTQLRRNCRPKHMKKCGTKRGRKGDNDEENTVIPAPDSVLKVCETNVKCETPSQKHILNLSTRVKKNLFDCSTPATSKITPKSSVKKRKHNLQENENTKLPKLDKSLSMICEDNELIELDSCRDQEIINSEMWIDELGLTLCDKEALVNNEKLNSNHMEAVNKLLRDRVKNSIGGLQLTEKVPLFNEEENKWIYKLPMDPAPSQSCQIHHNHKDHWVASISHNDQIYLLDSMGNERPLKRIVTNGLKLQLAKIYGKDKKLINIHIPRVVKQTNSTDCGLFAIAFVTSYCIRQELCYDLIYDSTKLRSHLMKCLESKTISEFPLTNKTISMRRNEKPKVVPIENFCVCNLPECLEDMVQCDTCHAWYHNTCVNAPYTVADSDSSFYCSFC